MKTAPDIVVLFPSKPGERAPETREEEARALVNYFRVTAERSPSDWWRLGLAVATTWQRILAAPGSARDLFRLLFVLNCSRNLGSVWFFMNLQVNRWTHNEMLVAGVVPNSKALWDAVEHAISENEAYCLGCHCFYDTTATPEGAVPSLSCSSCGRPDSMNLTVRTPLVCPKCFQARPADVETCDVCLSSIPNVMARNRIESWT